LSKPDLSRISDGEEGRIISLDKALREGVVSLEQHYNGRRDTFNPEELERAIEKAEEAHLFNFLYSDFVVTGIENVRKIGDAQKLYVSNHVSMSDFLVEAYIIWRRVIKGPEEFPRFIAGSNLFKWPFKKLWEKAGAVPIDRNNKSMQYLRGFNNFVLYLLGQGKSTLVYPDGGRNPREEEGRFRSGVFGQVIRTIESESKRDIQLVPMHIAYEHNPDLRFLDAAWWLKSRRDMSKSEFRKQFFDYAYFATDVLSYGYRFVEGIMARQNRGKCYLDFGEPISIRDVMCSNERKRKSILTEIARKGISKLKK